MKKIFALFVSVLVIVACTDPFDATSIWDKLNELENKINDTNTPEVECENNEIHYVTSDGKPLIPKKLGIATFGANLVSNNIENGIGTLVFDKDITEIGDNAFTNYSTLVSIIIPNSVTSIGVAAFNGCSGLTNVTIGNSVTSIGDYAFDRCSGLKEVHITDLDAWKNISFGNYYANPLNNSNAKLYLNGVEVK